ncbi:hypothetical protein HY214_00110 [Candidatus Roizmanbacteria bacterium]|nr:hypothetical protein [Candidatus Roizmanbacteria bacterium]
MAKGTFSDDTFEKILEFGSSTGKKAVQSVKNTFSPLKILDKATGLSTSGDQGIEKTEKGAAKRNDHTPVDFDNLEKSYKKQDSLKSDALRNRLFQLVKSGEEKAIQASRQGENDEKRREAYMAQEKKRKAEENRRAADSASLPQGKVRKSIFSPKKVAKREQTEVRPSAGKQ